MAARWAGYDKLVAAWLTGGPPAGFATVQLAKRTQPSPPPGAATDSITLPQVQAMLMEEVAAHHDPERVDLPHGLLGCSWAAAAFAVGAGCALGAVYVPAYLVASRFLGRT